MITRRKIVGGGLGLLAAGAASSARANTSDWRLADALTGRPIAWRDLPQRLSAANVVFAGEQHDDPETHKAELVLLEALHERIGGRLALAMEMLERDGQAALEDFTQGRGDEAALAKATKLWSNWAADYRPMVMYAKENKIPVYASNAPGRIVRQVGKEGLASTLAALSSADRALLAEQINAPVGDTYHKRFADVMGAGHGDSRGLDAATVARFYEAQSVRDDTMAETIVRALDLGKSVFHVNGSFHSDAGLGTAARVLWRRPLAAKIAVIKIIPVASDVQTADAAKYRGEADVLLFVPDKKKRKEA